MMKKRQAIVVLTVLCLFVCSIPALAESFHLEYKACQDGLILTCCSLSESKETLTIPATIDGKPVVAIDSYAFSSLESAIPEVYVKELILPDTIEIIDDYAFHDVNRLEKIILPKGLKQIGKQALPDGCGCTAVWEPDDETYVFQDGFVIEQSTGIAVHCFSAETSSIVIPDGVTELGEYLFFRWPIKKVSFPQSLRVIGEGAFAECDELMEITFPAHLIKIDDYAFSMCASIHSLSFPDTLLYIGESAFQQQSLAGYGQLRELRLNEGLLYIGDYAFADHQLWCVDLPQSLLYLGNAAFDTTYEGTEYSDSERFAY